MKKLRKELHRCIEKHGIGSEEALKVSKELDLLIVKEQHSLMRRNRNNKTSR